MIVSPKQRFVFVHNPKTAGTSIQQALTPYSNIVQRSIYQKMRFRLTRKSVFPDWRYRHYHKHMKASEAMRLIPEKVWDSFFTFGFVRNPFDRQVSLYLYTQRTSTTKSHKVVSKLDSFKEYVYALINEPLFQENRTVFQKTYFTDENGNTMVNFIGRYENLLKDIQFIERKIGILIDLPWELKSDRKPYRAYYDNETRRLVEEYVRPDLDEFDYDF